MNYVTLKSGKNWPPVTQSSQFLIMYNPPPSVTSRFSWIFIQLPFQCTYQVKVFPLTCTLFCNAFSCFFFCLPGLFNWNDHRKIFVSDVAFFCSYSPPTLISASRIVTQLVTPPLPSPRDVIHGWLLMTPFWGVIRNCPSLSAQLRKTALYVQTRLFVTIISVIAWILTQRCKEKRLKRTEIKK